VSGRLQVAFPLPASARASHQLVVENLRALGFLRVLADGELLHLDDLPPKRDLVKAKELLVVVDRLSITTPGDAPPRLGEGTGDGLRRGRRGGARAARRRAHAVHGIPHLQRVRHAVGAAHAPNLFSFNNPAGSVRGVQRVRRGTWNTPSR
jgi:excinuclease ABC subunit A